jgi:hypothetical protein
MIRSFEVGTGYKLKVEEEENDYCISAVALVSIVPASLLLPIVENYRARIWDGLDSIIFILHFIKICAAFLELKHADGRPGKQ